MKRTLLLTLALVLTWPFSSMAESTPVWKTHTDFPRGVVISKVATLSDPEQQYSLFLPAGYDPAKQWPVLLVMDPRGRGELALELFVDGARRHGWIVISSHQTRSDTFSTVTSDAFKALLKDLAEREFSVHIKRLYLAGMSGTGFVSWHLAKALPEVVAGVIGAGAGLPRDLESTGDSVSFDYYGLAGTADFNYQDQRRLDGALEEVGAHHHFAVWEGGHGWPPTAELTVAAVDWLELIAMKRGLAPRREDFIEAQYQAALKQAEAAADPLSRLRAWRQLSRDFDGLIALSEVRRRLAQVEQEDAVKKAVQQEKKLERQEISYMDRLNRWLATVRRSPEPPDKQRSLADLQIKRLVEQAQDMTDPFVAHSAQRRLEVTWVHASFYLPNEFDERGRLDRALEMLELAVAIFPQRPRGYLGMAEILTRTGRKERAFEALEKARDNGWEATDVMRSHAVWEPLHGDPRWQQLVGEPSPSADPGGG